MDESKGRIASASCHSIEDLTFPKVFKLSLTKENPTVKLRGMIWLLTTSLSVAGLAIAGCTQTVQPQATASPTVETTSPSSTTTASPNTTTQSPATEQPERTPDVVYVPTPEVVVQTMLETAKVNKNDVLYDLGSGDGRIVITAAQKYGARGTGIELRPELVKEAQENAKKAGVADRAQFKQADLFTTNFSDATVITLYLLPELNVKLRPRLLKELKPGTRIVSHDFDMGDWKPDRTVKVKGPQREHTIYFWTVPENPPQNLL